VKVWFVSEGMITILFHSAAYLDYSSCCETELVLFLQLFIHVHMICDVGVQNYADSIWKGASVTFQLHMWCAVSALAQTLK